jgi:hypothetical protein
VTQNVASVGYIVFWVAGGALILLLFAIAVTWPHRPKRPPGISGHREGADEAEHEVIRPDGYIDSFAKEIEEAGGGLPTVVKLAIPGVLLWWLIYLILFWAPR